MLSVPNRLIPQLVVSADLLHGTGYSLLRPQNTFMISGHNGHWTTSFKHGSLHPSPPRCYGWPALCGTVFTSPTYGVPH